jgi:hypothetical protein
MCLYLRIEALSLLLTRKKRDANGKSYLLSDSFREKMKDNRKEQV